MDYSVLEVRTPDGNVRKYPIDAPTAVIGRVAPAFVLIDHISVARRHALLRIGQDTTIQDLGSATGTLINGRRLEANETAPLPPGASLRFGEAHATFTLPESGQARPTIETAQPTVGAVPPAGPPTPRSSPPSPAPPEPDEQEVSFTVDLSSPTDAVATGAAVTATVMIQNRGSSMDEFTIRVPNLPEGWTRVTRPSVSLMPNVREEITVVIQPPREAAATAGAHEVEVAVSSRESRQEVIAVGQFTIRPFEKLNASIAPKRGGGPFTVSLENQGNAPYLYTLSTDVNDEEVIVDLEPGEIGLEPGFTEQVRVPVRPARGSAFSRSRSHQFQIDVNPVATAQDRRVLPAQLDVKPPLRHWRWMLAGIIVLALAGAGAYFYTNNCSGFTCGGDEDEVVATATEQPTTAAGETPSPTPADPTATVVAVGTLGPDAYAVVINSPAGDPDQCLNVRNEPNLETSTDFDEVCDGATVFIVEAPDQTAGDFPWMKVRYTRTEAGENPTRAIGDFEGWVAAGSRDGSEAWLEWTAAPD